MFEYLYGYVSFPRYRSRPQHRGVDSHLNWRVGVIEAVQGADVLLKCWMGGGPIVYRTVPAAAFAAVGMSVVIGDGCAFEIVAADGGPVIVESSLRYAPAVPGSNPHLNGVPGCGVPRYQDELPKPRYQGGLPEDVNR